MPPLTDLLAFEATLPRHTPAKEERIRQAFGITPAVYYLRLLRAARSLEGQQVDPITAHRLLR